MLAVVKVGNGGEPKKVSEPKKILSTDLGGWANLIDSAKLGGCLDCSFGRHGIYTSAIIVWSFLSQVLRDGKEASCQAAVARVVSYCQHAEIATPTSDTGDYCKARLWTTDRTGCGHSFVSDRLRDGRRDWSV